VHTNSQNGNGNLNGDANGNTDVDPSLRTGKKDEQLENAFHGSNEDPATDLTSGQHHSLHVLSVSTAPQKDVANHQSTTNANADTHANGNTNANVDPSFPAKDGNGNGNVDKDASNSLNLAKDVAGERHSLAVLSAATAPQDDPAHSQSSTHADANTDAQSPAVCKCPM
jgi:hypothetical protein